MQSCLKCLEENENVWNELLQYRICISVSDYTDMHIEYRQIYLKSRQITNQYRALIIVNRRIGKSLWIRNREWYKFLRFCLRVTTYTYLQAIIHIYYIYYITYILYLYAFRGLPYSIYEYVLQLCVLFPFILFEYGICIIVVAINNTNFGTIIYTHTIV